MQHTHKKDWRFQSLASSLSQHPKYSGILDVIFKSNLFHVRMLSCQINEIKRTVLVSWIAGPSAIGSEKGTPTSMMSAPPACMASKMGTVSCVLGYPAVTNVTNAGFPCSGLQQERKIQRNSAYLRLFCFEYSFESVHGSGM